MKKKKLKQAIRERKARTGESYSIARLHVLRAASEPGEGPPEDDPPSPPEDEPGSWDDDWFQLPPTFEELIEQVTVPWYQVKDGEDPTQPWYDLARHVGALNECLCSAEIVDDDVVMERLDEHYELTDSQRSELHRRMWDSGVEFGDRVCARHTDLA